MAELSDWDDDGLKQFSRRALVLGGLQAGAFALLGWRLFDLQVRGESHYGPLAEENRLNTQLIVPKRGRILDAYGRALADSDEIFRATLTPARAKNVAAVLERFRRVVPMSDDDVAKLTRNRKQNRSIAIVVGSELSFEQIAKLNLLAPDLPGIGTEVEWRRRYHAGPALGQIVGFVGNVDKPGPDDDPLLRLPGIRVGKGGIEGVMEADLRGTGGTEKFEIDARGRTIRTIDKIDPIAGRDITLAIDADLQNAVFNRLTKERIASAVIVDIASGDIRAMASSPSFDPAEINDGMTGSAWKRLADAEDKPLLNRAVAGQYAPGSIFKIVTALAALSAELATPDELISCPGHYEFGDHTYPCWNHAGHGDVTLKDALRMSCDIYFFELAKRVGMPKIAETAKALGFGASTRSGLAEEKVGLVPDARWKMSLKNSAWVGGDTMLAAIGQGYVLATPLQLAVMTARIASGLALKPAILKKPSPATGDVWPALAFDPVHLGAIRQGLLASVNDAGGTGNAAKLGDGRPVVAGKTGSSQVTNLTSESAEADLDWAKRDHALFAAYMPADAPRYAIATVVEHGGSGATSAAPLARDILTLVLDNQKRATDPDKGSKGQPGNVGGAG